MSSKSYDVNEIDYKKIFTENVRATNFLEES